MAFWHLAIVPPPRVRTARLPLGEAYVLPFEFMEDLIYSYARPTGFEQKDLVNMARVYRIPEMFAKDLSRDNGRPYISFGTNKFYFSLTDPAGSTLVIRDWNYTV